MSSVPIYQVNSLTLGVIRANAQTYVHPLYERLVNWTI